MENNKYIFWGLNVVLPFFVDKILILPPILDRLVAKLFLNFKELSHNQLPAIRCHYML